MTDLRVIEDLNLYPLSVAADKIALPAMRCTGLLDALGVVDRSGVDGDFEVYPAAALKAWELPYQKYKQTRPSGALAKQALTDLFQKVCTSCSWLTFSNEGDRNVCSNNDDAFDALIASLVARAAALGRTDCSRNTGEIALARVEGWIAVPKQDCLLEELGATHLGPDVAKT